MPYRLFAVAALLLLAACSALPPQALMPRFSVAEIDVKAVGLLEQHFEVGLRLANPNDFDLGIEAMEFELELNGQPFAKGLSQTRASIPATSSVVVRVDAVTQSHNLIRQFVTLEPDTLKQGMPYLIKGRVKTDKWLGWLPFEQKGVYGGEAKKPKGPSI
jgi:LEA14-like dessication related protein